MSARTRLTIAVLGVVGWAGLVYLGLRLFTTTPPTAAFDLELLLGAGRDVAAGGSPYDPTMLAGTAPIAERLFYSYPPVVAQLIALVAAVPSPVMFVAWVVAAVAGWAGVAAALSGRLAPAAAWTPGEVAFAAVALTPLLFPFAIGLLFGNLDVFFPLLYGLLAPDPLPAELPRRSPASRSCTRARSGSGCSSARSGPLRRDERSRRRSSRESRSSRSAWSSAAPRRGPTTRRSSGQEPMPIWSTPATVVPRRCWRCSSGAAGRTRSP